MKKGIWVSVIAGVAAVAAASVAVAAFIKRKSEALSDQLDYDPEEYFDADDDVVVEVTGDETIEAVEDAEEEVPACECTECAEEDCSACPCDEAPAEETAEPTDE